MPEIAIQIPSPRWKMILRPYCKTVRTACEAALPKKYKGEISVVLADDAFIRALNKQYRGKDKATNILSFTGEGDHLGDLVLAHETIEREAAEQGKKVKDHVTHLLVHGTLHLLGHDHENDQDAEHMEKLEIKILKILDVANPYL